MWPQTSSVPFVSANTGGLPLEPLLRQEEGESLRGKAEALTWFIAILHQAWSHDRSSAGPLFPPQASSREAVVQPTWPWVKHVKWCFLHFGRRCKKTK